MGFKSIDSEEKIGQVDVARGEPPKHVPEGHEKCAWYLEAMLDDKHDTVGTLRCSHSITLYEAGAVAADRGNVGDSPGAWYSEDYVRELKLSAQKIVQYFEHVARPNSVGSEEMRKLKELASDGS